jgi:hypothetical protein
LFRELNFTFLGDLSKRSMIFLLPVALAEVAGGGILPMVLVEVGVIVGNLLPMVFAEVGEMCWFFF